MSSNEPKRVNIAVHGGKAYGYDGDTVPIGWAWFRTQNGGAAIWASNGFYNGTVHEAELWAIISALIDHPTGALLIQSNSEYALSVAKWWAHKWARNNWVKKDGREIKNLELVQLLYRILSERTDPVDFKTPDETGFRGLEYEAAVRANDAVRRAARARDGRESLRLYQDSDGRDSHPMHARIMVDIIESAEYADDVEETVNDDPSSLFSDLGKDEPARLRHRSKHRYCDRCGGPTDENGNSTVQGASQARRVIRRMEGD